METLYVALWEGEKTMFKSYYVVWKLPASGWTIKKQSSLNRTM